MDNFGIFKLLTSAFDFYQKNSSKLNNQNSQKNTTISNENETQAPIKSEVARNVYAKPLQEGMIKTMNSHQAFINRVKEKNKIK